MQSLAVLVAKKNSFQKSPMSFTLITWSLNSFDMASYGSESMKKLHVVDDLHRNGTVEFWKLLCLRWGRDGEAIDLP